MESEKFNNPTSGRTDWIAQKIVVTSINTYNFSELDHLCF